MCVRKKVINSLLLQLVARYMLKYVLIERPEHREHLKSNNLGFPGVTFQQVRAYSVQDHAKMCIVCMHAGP